MFFKSHSNLFLQQPPQYSIFYYRLVDSHFFQTFLEIYGIRLPISRKISLIVELIT